MFKGKKQFVDIFGAILWAVPAAGFSRRDPYS
jgi:hypothetical protein